MAAQETGATAEQVRRAADKFFSCSCEECLQQASRWASFVVSPDERIVSVDDLKRLLSISRVDTGDLIDRITALIGE